MQVAIVLPPREGFSAQAVGAIGLLVHRLATPGDVVIGQAGAHAVFAGRRFVPAGTPFWPPFGRVERYMVGVVGTVYRLQPDVIEVHNRANLAARFARASDNGKHRKRVFLRKETKTFIHWCVRCGQSAPKFVRVFGPFFKKNYLLTTSQAPSPKRAGVILFVHNDPQAMRGARSAAERTALLQSMTIVCVSGYLAARFMDGVDPSVGTPVVLPNCLDLSLLPPRLAPDAREQTILFVGRVVADKGADAFVRACAAVLPRFADWRAEIIGADRFWADCAATPFQRALAPSAENAGIVLRGYRPHADVLHAMAHAAIVVVPSRWPEPFGLTALEAMASGAALICSRRGGLPEVAGEAALYTDPDEPGGLEAAIATLVGNPDLRARYAALGLARARLFDATEARSRLCELRERVGMRL